MTKNITNYTPEQLSRADEEVNILLLLRGMTAVEGSYWAYLSVPPSKFVRLKEMMGKVHKGERMSQYGEILACGLGMEPPDEVRVAMVDIHGVNHLYENETIEKALELADKMNDLEDIKNKAMNKSNSDT